MLYQLTSSRAVQQLQMLGHAVERSAGHMHTPHLGDAKGSFEVATDALASDLERLWTLRVYGGLPTQTTQALARLAAQSTPQHLLRGAAVPPEQARAYDHRVESFWARLTGEPAPLDVNRRIQLHLPLRAGGLSAGGVEVRADAALLAGTLGSLREVQKAAGVDTVAQLRQALPQHVNVMDQAVASLSQKGAKDRTRLWQSDQPQPVKGMQRTWTREVQARLHEHLLAAASQRHAAAIRSASTSEASRFLDPPTAAEDKMTDKSFQTAVRRRLGLRPVPATAQVASHCQNRRPDGSKCGELLDNDGHHAVVCEVGGALLRRHDGLRDLIAGRLSADLSVPCLTEQRCPQFDKAKPDGTMSEARLDIATDIDGTTALIDVSVVDVFSTNLALERQRSRRDGAVASAMADAKRSKYPGPNVVPLVLESFGRIDLTGLAWLRRAYRGQPDKLQCLLRAMSAHVQSHTSAMVWAASYENHCNLAL